MFTQFRYFYANQSPHILRTLHQRADDKISIYMTLVTVIVYGIQLAQTLSY